MIRFRVSIRRVLLLILALSVFLGSYKFNEQLERVNWRPLTERDFHESIDSGSLIMIEASDVVPFVRWDHENDFMESKKCWRYLNWNNVKAYRIRAEFFHDKKYLWLRDWYADKAHDSPVTAVEFYDPQKRQFFASEERDPDSIIETVNQLIGSE